MPPVKTTGFFFHMDVSKKLFVYFSTKINKEPDVPDIPKSEEIMEPIQKLDIAQSNSASNVSFNSDLMNLIITENRLQNTELRMAMMKMNEKVDKLLENQGENQNSKHQQKLEYSLEQNVKKVMNKLFKQLKSEIDPTKTYSGDEVIQLVAVCVKSSTESLLLTTK